jgi:hypothetical protein
MRTYATKYVELMDRRGEELAKRWYKDAKANPKTPSFQKLPEDKVIAHAVNFYQNFSKMFTSEKPEKDALKFFENYAARNFNRGIPLDEAIYALILMRRHIWLFADFQDVFMRSADKRLEVETLSRTILIFGYAEYEIAKRYQELILADIEKKLGC